MSQDDDNGDILSGADERPEEDFESYLSKKIDEIVETTPASDLPVVATPLGAGVEVEADESSEPQPYHEERIIERKIVEHPIAGKHVVETSRVLSVSEEWVRIVNESYHKAITEANPDEIIDRIAKLEHLRWLIPAEQMGLEHALFDLLKNESVETRAKLLARDKAYKADHKARVEGRKPKSERKVREPKASQAGLSKSEKSVALLAGMGFDRGYIEKKLKEQGLFDEAASAHLDKLGVS